MECGMIKNAAKFECIPWFLPKGLEILLKINLTKLF